MKKIAVSLLVLTLAVFLAVPAVAEFNPYGSMRLLTGWYALDTADAPGGSGGDNDSDVYWSISNISRVGAKFKTGDISGHVELGMVGAESGNNTYDRLLYGTWDFGGGSLMVGQNYPPYTMTSAQIAPRIRIQNDIPGDYDAENTFIGYGALWEARKPQIKLTLTNGFYVSLIQPEADQPAGAGAGDADTTMPKICVGYDLKTEGLSLNGGLAYNSYNYEETAAGGVDEAVSSYLVYVNVKVPLGMVDLQGSIHGGQNLTDFGLWDREEAAQAVAVGDDIENSTCYGGYLQVAIPLDPAKITVGYGYVQSDNDDGWGKDADQQQSYFVNAKLPIADTFFVVPEFSYYDQMDNADGDEEDDAWYLGLLWRMDF